MSVIATPDKQWNKLRDFIKDCPGVYLFNEEECRRFLEGVLWITRSGAKKVSFLEGVCVTERRHRPLCRLS